MFYLVKLKVAFINTIFWCWNWALIDKSYFDNWNWLNLKYAVHQHAFQNHSAICSPFFQKKSRTYSLMRQNRKFFFNEKTPVLPNQCCLQRFGLFETKFGQIQHWYWVLRWSLKNGVISWMYWIFKFCLNKFCQYLQYVLLINLVIFLKDTSVKIQFTNL